MIVVDTTVWIDFLRGTQNPESNYLVREARFEPFGLLDVALCEILQGVPDENASAAVVSSLHAFHILESGGLDLAIEAARNYRKLRGRGITVRKLVDCWIASFCLIRGHSLLHRDRDFDPFEEYLGLSVFHP